MAKRKKPAGATSKPPEMIGRIGLALLLDVMAERSLSAPLTKTAVIVARHMREEGEEAGLSYPSHRTIAEATGLPLRTVRFHMATLVERGFLRIVQRGNGDAVRYLYVPRSERQSPASHSSGSERQYAAAPKAKSERQLAASHKRRVSGNTQPVTPTESERQMTAKKVADDCQRKDAVSDARPLKIKAEFASERQSVAAPNREGTELGAFSAPNVEAVPQIVEAEKMARSDTHSGRASSARRGTSDDAFPQVEASDDGEDADTLEWRALGVEVTPDEPPDFVEDAFLFPEEIEAMAARSFEGEAWRAPDAERRTQDKAA